MKTIRLFFRDMQQGTFRRWFLIVLPLTYGISQGWMCHRLIESMTESGTMYSSGTVLDYFMYGTEAMYVYHFDPQQYFEIPIYWFALQIGAAYFTAYYAYNDFTGSGRQLFIAARSRRSWWISKCLWCTVSVVLYFVVAFGTICVMARIYNADMSLSMTTEFAMRFNPNVFSLSQADFILIMIVLPILITMAVSLLQMLVGFILTPVISFALVCAMYVLSAYYTAWYFWGSYTMWVRSSYLDEEGVYPIGGLLIAVCMILMSWVLGVIYFDNRDVIE